MTPRSLMHVFGVVLILGSAPSTAQDKAKSDKDKKERTATVSGILKSRTPIKNRKDVLIEILGDGEETVRRYGVPYVPKGKGHVTKVLDAVHAAKIGDRVFCNLIYGAHGYEGGFVVVDFQVLKKADSKTDDGKIKK